MRELANDYAGQECFFCGRQNPIGLKLRFFLNEDTEEVVTEYTPDRPFGGWGRILHGGIQAGLFDEIMGWTTHQLTGECGMTADLTVSYKKPVVFGTPVRLRCRITERRRRIVHLEAWMETLDGLLCAEAHGRYFLIPEDRFSRLIRDGAE